MRVPQVSERIKEAPAQALRGVFAGIGQLLLVTDKLRHKTPAGAGVPRTRTPEPAETPTAAPAATDEAAADSSSAAAAAPKKAASQQAVPKAAVAEPPVVADVVVVEAAGPVVAEPVAAKPLVAEPAAAPPLVAEPVATEPLVAEPVAAKPVAAKPVPAQAARATARKPAKQPPARDFDKTGNVRLLEGEEDAEAAAADTPAVAADVTPPPLPNYDELSIASLRARLRNLDLTQLKQVADYERAHQARAEVIAMFERRAAKLAAEPQAGV
jgi:hypothetical protein